MTLFKKKNTEPFKRPNKKISDKATIVQYAKDYLKTNSLIDMNGFIHDEMEYPDAHTAFIRDVAYLMWGEGIYDFADTYKRDEYLLAKKQSWIQRNAIPYAIILILISAAVSLLFSKLGDRSTDQLQFLRDTRQDSIIQQLQGVYHDSLTNFENRIEVLREDIKDMKDTLAKYK